MQPFNLQSEGAATKVILDTNILRYSSHPVLAPQIEKVLEKFALNSVIFSISQITVFELLQAANEEKKKQGIILLNKFPSIVLDQEILTFAAELSGLYQKYGGANLRIFDSGDIFIAASTIITRATIITANQKDYPHPIFQEEESFVISNKDKFGRTSYLPIYILKPNYEFLQKKLL